ncbi:hypothetical protein SAMN04487970_10952 [Paenibacillus tianmuensis]|uniref:CYTH domain-containing protein n=2 Tax=Paenibacillus tianmuensis TaxID=624147 RepID=A0A1G4U1M0_9BACL|nr:hypothetical protein SAMN04487970_10952 [Paenibacillus tianmuensis]
MMNKRSKWIGALSVIVLSAALTVSSVLPAAPVKAASNMEPDYEVKLLMTPGAVLGSDDKLKNEVRSAFGMPDKLTKMNVQFLDTDGKDIYGNGWSPRIRKKEGDSGFELSYKKQYPIVNGNIDVALTKANQEGFDASDTNYEAQVEWGYQNKTLSITRSKKAKKSGYSGVDLPSVKDSRELLIDKAPGKFDKWLYAGWGTEQLQGARIYGPVLAKRYTGTWDGLKTYIEVWPIRSATGTGTENVVEISFKTDDRETASQKHDELVTYLQSKGWFLAKDSLKTQLIMDHY